MLKWRSLFGWRTSTETLVRGLLDVNVDECRRPPCRARAFRSTTSTSLLSHGRTSIEPSNVDRSTSGVPETVKCFSSSLDELAEIGADDVDAGRTGQNRRGGGDGKRESGTGHDGNH